jgi:hypothetical protein
MCDTTCEIVFNFTEDEYKQEWDRMWGELRYAFINRKRKVDPFSGDVKWVYVGVCNYENQGLVHFFTHKKHPVTLRNEYYCVKISPEMEEIVNKFLEEKKFYEDLEKEELIETQVIQLVMA